MKINVFVLMYSFVYVCVLILFCLDILERFIDKILLSHALLSPP